MSEVCANLHKMFQSLPRMTFPFDAKGYRKTVFIFFLKTVSLGMVEIELFG